VLDNGKLVAEGSPDELKRLVPGGHITLRFTDASELDLAARVLGASARDDEALSLQIPSDGNVGSLRALLARLDDSSLEVESLTVHTPDLDDVFFALTGHPSTEKETVR
jgi:ABC-2 type transport system ATP-binding protein